MVLDNQVSVVASAPGDYIVCSDFLAGGTKIVRASKPTRVALRWPEYAPPAGGMTSVVR